MPTVAFRFDRDLILMTDLFGDRRLESLQRELRVGRGECPFIFLDKGKIEARLAHYDGGRDVTYVAVTRAADIAINISGGAVAVVTIGYAPFVEGTTIIYDLTDEMMQGKARPFACDLSRTPCRMYAVLPFQIEQVKIAVDKLPQPQRLLVGFLDARGERIQAALPFRVQVVAADRAALDEYACTDRQGQFSRDIPELAGRANAKIVVRSLLTGRDDSAAFSPR